MDTTHLDVLHFSGLAMLTEVFGLYKKPVLSLNMCEYKLVTSVFMFDASSTPCTVYQQNKCCTSWAFCHSKEKMGQDLDFLIQPERIRSAVTHCYKFRKGMALILH